MIDIWPLSVFYRAYFGTMKFKERFAFCVCVVLLVVPFIWLRFRDSNDKNPLMLGVSDTQSLLDRMDFNAIDHTHHVVARSRESEPISPSEGRDNKSDLKRSIEGLQDNENQVVRDNVKDNVVDEKDQNKAVNNDVDYEYDDPWLIWRSMVKSRQITSPDDKDSLNMVLEAMAYKPIVAANVGYKGTQLKALFILEGAQRVVFKPMRYPRDHVVEGTPFAGFDRHNGEIAAFHLDRILGFYRAPPVVGRRVNLEEEVEPIGEKRLLDTFFKQGKDTCFYGVCYYCKKAEAACANGTIMEGSVTLWLPPGWPLRNWRHPWQRSYNQKKKAAWETRQDYCKKVMKAAPYESGPRLLDITDTALFDFLIGNADRHHYETFQEEGDVGMLLNLDNAKSFGNPYHDEMSILAPVYQCCRIRQSTWNRFQSLNKTKSTLSSLLRKAMESDPVFPILTELHFKAIDRRLKIAISTIEKCIEKNGENTVLISDEAIENGDNN